MKNMYVSVKCPSCQSTVQVKAKSLRTDVIYCPVCETGEIENPDFSLILDFQKIKHSVRQPVLLRV